MCRNKKIKNWTAVMLLVLSMTGGMFAIAEEQEVAYSPTDVVVITNESVAQGPATTADPAPATQYEETTVIQDAGTSPAETRYRLTFYDLEGREIFYESLRAGESIQMPEFTPERDGLDFQYWYDLFTYDQVGTPEPFAFGTPITRNMNLVPYYLYATAAAVEPNGQDQSEHMVENVSDQLIFDILMGDASNGQASIAEIPSTMQDENAKVLIAEILNLGDPVASAGETTRDASVITDERTDAIISDILESTDAPAEEPGTVMTQDQTKEIIDQILLESFQTPNPDEQAPDADYVMSMEQVNSLIEEVLTDGQVLQPAPENEEVLLQEPQENPADVPDETTVAPQATDHVMPQPVADALIDDILSERVVVPQTGQEESSTNVAQTGDQESVPADTGEPAVPEEAPETQGQAPWVEVAYAYDGELLPGTAVTVTANVHNVDPAMQLAYQWENNASGSYQTVPGATDKSYSFLADDTNTDCDWRVNISAAQ